MHSISLLTTTFFAILTPLTSAFISSIHVPSHLTPNTTINVTITTIDYIQAVEDIAIAFGLSDANTTLDLHQNLGTTFLGSFYLGPKYQDTLGNISAPLLIPSWIEPGKMVFNAISYTLGGVYYSPFLKNFSVETTVLKAVPGASHAKLE